MQGHVHWTDVLFSKLSDTVKLVGPTINCEGAPFNGDPQQHWRKNPHVQSYLVATDQVGITLLLKDSKVFKCFSKISDTIYHSELGSSQIILDAGYNIDCLMVSRSSIAILIIFCISFSSVTLAIDCVHLACQLTLAAFSPHIMTFILRFLI
jgi:hypothetical protein